MAAFAQRGWVAISPDCGNFVFYFAIALQFILLVSVARVSVSKVLSCVHYYRSSDCPCLGWCYASYIDMLRLVSLAVVSRPHACHDSPFISSSSSSSVITHCVNESISAYGSAPLLIHLRVKDYGGLAISHESTYGNPQPFTSHLLANVVVQDFRRG